MSDESHNTMVIGLVGGIASGKSYVANQLVELGAELIDADAIGHAVLLRSEVLQQLTELFGEKIIGAEGTVDRKVLGKLVFADSESSQTRLNQLESIVHPLIRAEAVRLLRSKQHRSHPPPAVVLDAPLLLEAGWEPLCDIILFVDAPRQSRLQRALRRGWTEVQFDQREASQRSLEEKRRSATHIVESNGDLSKLKTQLRAIWNQL